MTGGRPSTPVLLIIGAVLAVVAVSIIAAGLAAGIWTGTGTGDSTVTPTSHPEPTTPAETATVEIEGVITALSSGDGVFHLVVDGHGVLPIVIAEGIEFDTEGTSTVTIEVPADVDAGSSVASRFAALEEYSRSIRGPLTVVAVRG